MYDTLLQLPFVKRLLRASLGVTRLDNLKVVNTGV